MSERNLTTQGLKRAFAQGEIAAAVAIGGVIRFVFKGGIQSGYLITHNGATRRFINDTEGQRFLEGRIKQFG